MKITFVTSAIAFFLSAQGATYAQEALNTTPNEARVDESYFVFDPHKTWLKDFATQPDLTIDHVRADGYELHGPVGLRERLNRAAVMFWADDVPESIREAYPSYEQIVGKLKAIQSKHSGIMKLFSIGKTAKGRDLWVMKVSDRPEVDEIEPEVKYISSMHGDEITGRELMVFLLDDIGEKYGKDAAITELVNSTEIFVLASMNPDGSEAKRRGNGNNIDLNRNFPDFSTSDNQNKPNGRQPETQAIMKWQAERDFALSANFHGGAEVVNYAWDTLKDSHPFESLLVTMSLAYSSRAPYIYNSKEFPKGITNGYAWYEVNGGMQDWSYYWHNDLQFTVELSNVKYPDYSTIPGYYKDNRDALLHFLRLVHQGAGFSYDAPGLSGQARITRILDDGKTQDLGKYAFTHSQFYKALEPGRYEFSVTLNGNPSAAVFNLDVKADTIIPDGNYSRLQL